MIRKAGILTTLLLGLSVGAILHAQGQEEDTGDDPSRGVARVSFLQGDVDVRRGDSGEMVAAAINAPLMSQDHIQTSNGSLAEIQFDSANLVRIAGGSDLGLADIRYRR